MTGPSSLVALERIAVRVPLAVRCRAAATGRPLGAGLVATAWPVGDPFRTVTAQPSPVSPLLGFGRLPGLHSAATRAYAPAGEELSWPAVLPRRYILRILDAARPARVLPVVVPVDAPAPAPLVVDLYDAPTAPAPSGWASICGEVRRNGTTRGIPYAALELNADGTAYLAMTDEAGRFALHLPYPEALPPLGGGPARVPTWPVSITVRAEPAHLVWAPGAGPADPPTQASIRSQAPAMIQLGGPRPSLARTLRLHEPLILTLPVDPA